MMSSERLGPFSETYKDYPELIRQSGRFLLEAVNGILDLAKIEAKKFDLEIEKTDNSTLVDEVESLTDSQINKKGLAFVIETQDLPVLVVDPSRLKQVLFNVIGNAIKFTEKGSVRLNNNRDELGFRISVSNTSVGMTVKQANLALKPFEQIHGTSLDKRYQGTGLGVSLSHQIMVLHGGDLEVSSEPGKGTTVTLLFPSAAKKGSRS